MMTQYFPIIVEQESNGTFSAWVAGLPGLYRSGYRDGREAGYSPCTRHDHWRHDVDSSLECSKCHGNRSSAGSIWGRSLDMVDDKHA
jgi:hypothetical protein